MNSKASIHTLESTSSRYYRELGLLPVLRLPYVKEFIVLWGPLEVTTPLN